MGIFKSEANSATIPQTRTNGDLGGLPDSWYVHGMKSKRSFFLVLVPFLFSLFMVLFSQSAVSATPDPTEQFRPFLKKVTDTLADPGLKTIPKSEQCQRIIDIVREHFDFREMSKRVIGQQWRNLSEKEQAEFERLFTQLLQYAYVGKIDEYSGQQVQFVQQRIKGDRAEVQTLLVDKDKSIPVFYIMLLKDDRWMAYDVVVEGVSLIRNYMEQFSEILRKEGYAGLVQQIERKIAELEKNVKKI